MTGARGEGFIQAGDREVRVLFTNRALADSELALGKSVLEVLQGFVDSKSGILDLGQLLRNGMQAARRDSGAGRRTVTLTEAYEVMDEAGFGTVASVIMEAVGAVLGYSSENEEPPEDEPDPNSRKSD